MMSRSRWMLPALLTACMLWTSSVSAQTFFGGGLNPGDGNTAGTTDSVLVSGVPSFTSLTVSVDFNSAVTAPRHTWAGDVTLILIAPDATSTPLVVRPGKTSASSGFGDDSNFLGTYTFTDSATNRIIDIANTVPGDDNAAGDIAPGNFRATNNIFNGDGGPTFTGEQLQTLNALNGNVGNGTWQLFYSDSATPDYSPVSGWSITFSAVPEPTTWALMGTALVGAAGWGYRRNQLKNKGAKTRFVHKTKK